MKIENAQAQRLLAGHDHGVLCTVHPDRGVDAVPVVYALDNDHLCVPIDVVKPKASTRLQRERNLEADPRATLLIEHWDRDDWSQLWWVRAELVWEPDADEKLIAKLSTQLSLSYAQYRDKPFVRLLVFRIINLTGWDGSAK